MIAFFSAISLWQFIAKEYKTAIHESFFGKLNYIFSGIFFIATGTLVITFISALVISSLAINTIFAIQERKLVYIDAMARPWQFSQLIPFALIVLLVLSIIYVIIEYFAFSKRSLEGPMEIQQYFEQKIIKRVPFPFTIFSALGFLLIIIVLIPYLLSEFSIFIINHPESLLTQFLSYDFDFNYFFPENPQLWQRVFVFIPYLMLGPMIYLIYYSTLGNSQILFHSFRVLRTPKYLRKVKHWGMIFVLILGLLSLVSSIYSLISDFPILWGQYSDITTSYKDLQGGFLENLIMNIMREVLHVDQSGLDDFKYFTSIVPLDFILFIITSVGFGLLGFSSEFLKKEPLNRPLLVKFATYILIGIAFNIFLNILTTWPWVLPENFHFLTLEFSDPEFQKIVLFFFGPLLVVQNILTVLFLVYNIFGNKQMRYQIDFNVLNEAIKNREYPTIEFLSRNSNPNLRFMVVNSILEQIDELILIQKAESKEKEKILDPTLIKIIQNLLIDKDIRIHQIITHLFEKIVDNCTIDEILPLISTITSNKEINNDFLADYESILNKFTTKHSSDLERIIKELYRTKITTSGEQLILSFVKNISHIHPSSLQKILMHLLNSENPFLQKGVFDIVGSNLKILSNQLEEIFEIGIKLYSQADFALKKSILTVNSQIVIKNSRLMERFFNTFNLEKLSKDEEKLIFLGAAIRIMGEKKNQFEYILEKIKPLMTTESEFLQEQIAISFGSLFTSTSLQHYLVHFHPFALRLSQVENQTILENLFSSFDFMMKINPEIIKSNLYIKGLFNILKNSERDLKKRVLNSLSNIQISIILPNIEQIIEDICVPLMKGQKRLDNKERELLIALEDYFAAVVPNNGELFISSQIYINLLSIPWKELKLQNYITDLFKIGAFANFGFFCRYLSYFQTTSLLQEDIRKRLIFSIKSHYVIASLDEKIKSPFSIESSLIDLPIFGDLRKEKIKDVASIIEKECNYDVLKEEINDFLSTNSIHLIQTSLDFMSKILDYIPQEHKLFYPKIIKLISIKDVNVYISIVKILGKCAHIQPDLYIPKHIQRRYNKKRVKDQIDPQFWSYQIFPLIVNVLSQKKSTDIEFIWDLIDFILENTSDIMIFIKFLKNSLQKSTNSDVKVAILNVFQKLPGIYKDKRLYSILLKLIKSNDEKIGLAALKLLSNMLVSGLEILENIRSSHSDYSRIDKSLQRLIENQMDNFFKIKPKQLSSIALKQEYLKVLEQFIPFSIEFSYIFASLAQILKEKSVNLTEKALKIAMKIISIHPHELFIGIKFYQKSLWVPEISTKKLILHQISKIYKEQIIKIPNLESKEKIVGQILFIVYNFSYIEEKEIDSQIMNLIHSIFFDYPDMLPKFSEILIKIIEYQYRNNSFDIFFEYINIFFSHFDQLKTTEKKLQVIKLTYRFSRYKNENFALGAIQYIPKIINSFPAKIYTVLGILYNFCRISNSSVLLRTFSSFNSIIETTPELTISIMKNLQKIQSKSQSVAIHDYLEKLDEKYKEETKTKEKNKLNKKKKRIDIRSKQLSKRENV